MPIPLKASNGFFAGTFRSVHFPISKEQVQANTPMLAESFQQVTVDARVSPSRAIIWGDAGKPAKGHQQNIAYASGYAPICADMRRAGKQIAYAPGLCVRYLQRSMFFG